MDVRPSIDYSKDPSYNLNYQIILLITKMHDAKLNEDWKRYWWAFDSIVKITKTHFSENTKKYIQSEYNKLYYAETELKKEPNETTRDNKIFELRKNFALTYESVITDGLIGMDIIKVDNEGMINFGEQDIEDLSHVIRSRRIDKFESKNEEEEEYDASGQE
jgi:hypothetical protein